MNKLIILKAALFIGGLYYVIGAIVHFFGLTVFPFYDSGLYSPYHDTVLALVGIVLSFFPLCGLKKPSKARQYSKIYYCFWDCRDPLQYLDYLQN